MKKYIVRQAFMGSIILEIEAENEEEAIDKFSTAAEELTGREVLDGADFENPEAEEI